MNRTGREAEDLALAYLTGRGLRLIERNYSTRLGEIDLVMGDGDCLVFVEVRFRRPGRFGDAVESVGRRKQGRLLRVAEAFLLEHPVQARRPCRFDVVGMGADQGKIEWIQDAFGH
ncbi:MAG: YraN family protein [Gammaproteobacteria bacterium]|nr:YraN family protein [Gammaproteobacteria bacterium]MBU1653873.1 YraN family protein [Gammaproteobacteria bacterium]MBU1962585.1 YraN family protein [Gammaproteobacteria bacterium]